MAEYDSPLGSRKVPGSKLREFSVPDESGYDQSFDQASAFAQSMESEQDIAQLEKNIKEAKEAKRTGRERLSSGAKKRIEMLIGMMRDKVTFTVEDTEFTLQTLKAKEMREAMVATYEFDATIQSPYEMRKQLLARSLVSVAGVSIEQFLNSDTLESKLEFVEELPEVLLTRIFNEYQDMVTESTNKFSIKTDAEAQEVVADLKK